MPHFSDRSLASKRQVHPLLQKLLDRAIENINFTIIDGRRNEEEQNRLYKDGKSKLKYPQSKHNAKPSLAVDIAPYPIDWQDRIDWYFQVGYILGIANQMNIDLRVGMDWDGDYQLVPNDQDESFLDLPHIELDVEYNEETTFWPI